MIRGLIVVILALAIFMVYKGWSPQELLEKAKEQPSEVKTLVEEKDPAKQMIGKWKEEGTDAITDIKADGSYTSSGRVQRTEALKHEMITGTLRIDISGSQEGKWKLEGNRVLITPEVVHSVELHDLTLDAPAFVQQHGQEALNTVVQQAKANFKDQYIKQMKGQTIPLEIVSISSRKMVTRDASGQEYTSSKVD